MDTIAKWGEKFFRIANDKECPLYPGQVEELCSKVEKLQKSNRKVLFMVAYITGVLSVTHGMDLFTHLF